MTYRGYIFDLDGVLTDTAHFHYLAWLHLAQDLGLQFTEKDNELLKGVSRQRSFEIMLELNHREHDYTAEQKAEFIDRKNNYYRALLGELCPADVLPGVLEFLHDARAKGIRLAVASASRNAGIVLENLRLTGEFDYIADQARPGNFPELRRSAGLAAVGMPRL